MHSAETRPTIDMQLFGARLRQARMQAGLSQTDLARDCGITVQQANGLEHGKSGGTQAQTLLAFAWRLHVSSDYLLGLTDTPA